MATIVGPVEATVSTATLEAGFCPTTEQQRLDTYGENLIVSFPTGFSTVVEGNTIPNPKDRDKIWFRFDSAGRPDRWYTYADGAWLAPHVMAPGTIILWKGTQSEIATLDGGTLTADPDDDTATTGQFWRELTEAVGRVAVHPDPNKTLIQFQSTVPSSGGTDDKITVMSTGGEEMHTLTEDELADHRHQLNSQQVIFNTGSGNTTLNMVTTVGSFNNYQTGQPTNTSTNDDAHNTMQPFIGLYYIYRTRRTHYRID